ncbi:ETEC_3214 domain-containing protein [Streptomyces sp. NPDC058304]|uniref:ETEC_3214 domain-containing protein n=1 Tax=Streptomyces sp. NPDC058304 TaxID=3346437 RepID=UPI0036EC44B9
MTPGDNRRDPSDGRKPWYLKTWFTHPLLLLLYTIILTPVFVAVGSWMWGQLHPPPGPEEKVSRLSYGITVAEFKEILGAAPKIERPVEKSGWRELLWLNDDYAVQAITLTEGHEVLGYSVTTRSKEFRPLIPVFEKKLGRVHFSEIFPDSDDVYVNLLPPTPNGTWWYSEIMPPSGATQEITFMISASSEGRGSDNTKAHYLLDAMISVDPIRRDCVSQYCPYNVKDQKVVKARKELAVTTYAVLGPKMDVQTLPDTLHLGPTAEDELNRFLRRD